MSTYKHKSEHVYIGYTNIHMYTYMHTCKHKCEFVCTSVHICLQMYSLCCTPENKGPVGVFSAVWLHVFEFALLGAAHPNMRATDVGLDVPSTPGAVYHKHVTICMCCICFVGTCFRSVSTMQNVRIICNSCLVRLPNARKQTSPLRNQSNTCIKTWTSKQQCYAKLLNGNMPQSNPASRLHRMQNTKQNHPNTNR